jgi:hypothetical protein
MHGTGLGGDVVDDVVDAAHRSVTSEGVTLRGSDQRDLDNPIDNPNPILPLHYQFAWVHAELRDNVQ